MNAHAEVRGLRASPSSPARSSCALPVVSRRSSHRHVHVDHTELLTVASAGMGKGVGLKVDGGVSSQLANVVDAATTLERRGYDGCWTAEINHDPFLPLTLAAEHTDTIELGTSIAVAFARNPMTVANVGWDLQEYSGGRLIWASAHRSDRTSRSDSACRGVGRCRACESSYWRCGRSGRVGGTARN